MDRQRQWRLPVISDSSVDFCDHLVGFRNLYFAAFTDVGNAYVREHPSPRWPWASAAARAEFAWISFLERTTFRLDVAKAVNTNRPVQVWFALMHPF